MGEGEGVIGVLDRCVAISPGDVDERTRERCGKRCSVCCMRDEFERDISDVEERCRSEGPKVKSRRAEEQSRVTR